MRFLGALITVILLIVVIGAAWVWSGVYNVAAKVPHWKGTRALLEIALERSVVNHSDGIHPPSLDDPGLSESGLHHFHPMCRLCHGAPGYERREFAKGLYPIPPELTDAHVREEYTDAQLFWIIQNGLKMTGMPSFGPTHSENELWSIVALVNQLPEMTPEAYRAGVEAHGRGNGAEGRHGGEGDDTEGGHSHGEESQPSETGHGREETPSDGGGRTGEAAHSHQEGNAH